MVRDAVSKNPSTPHVDLPGSVAPGSHRSLAARNETGASALLEPSKALQAYGRNLTDIGRYAC